MTRINGFGTLVTIGVRSLTVGVPGARAAHRAVNAVQVNVTVTVIRSGVFHDRS